LACGRAAVDALGAQQHRLAAPEIMKTIIAREVTGLRT
jgi:hypothetical protein